MSDFDADRFYIKDELTECNTIFYYESHIMNEKEDFVQGMF